jgi:hypothetical protein
MRVTVILAILARLLDKHVFNPNFLFEGGSETRHIFLRLAMENSERESFCRALFASSLMTEQERTVEDRIELTMNDMLSHVGGLLPENSCDSFEADLEHLIRSAYELWKAVARDQRYFEPNFQHGPSTNLAWRSFSLSDTDRAGEVVEVESRDDPGMLAVFPRLYIVEDNGELVSISTGALLRKSQTLEATNEIERDDSDGLRLSPTIPRTMSNRVKSRHARGASTTQQKGLGIQPFLE